ncbi:MAG: hypothetical protein IPK79_07665 [Vampirovibrionales bacterium]|nr:hypothetical protein [Vampirovibrionales bacterium]
MPPRGFGNMMGRNGGQGGQSGNGGAPPMPNFQLPPHLLERLLGPEPAELRYFKRMGDY